MRKMNSQPWWPSGPFCVALMIGTLLWGLSAQAAEVPRAFLAGNRSFLSQGLGESCYAFDLPGDTLPCNAAYISMKHEREFRANIFFGNNVEYLQEASDLVHGSASADEIQKIAGRENVSMLDANIEAGFRMPTFGIAVSPFQLTYFAHIRNPSLPEVQIYAAQEQSARLQVGSYLGDDVFWGVQLRALQRKYLSSEFFLTDALAEGGNQYFATQEQQQLFLEPSLMWAPEKGDWHPEVSASLVGQGWENRHDPTLPMVPRYHLSGSVHTPVALGVWGIGLDTYWDSEVESASQSLTLGSYFQFGMLTVFGSVGERLQSVGFNVESGRLNLGLVFANETIEDSWGDTETSNRISLLLGIAI